MSIIGTGIAAGVANTGQAARTQTTSDSGRDAQRAGATEQTDKFTISQLHDASATRDADEDMPDGQAAGYEKLYKDEDEAQEENANDQIHDADAPASTPTGITPLKPSYAPGYEEHPLFHALDIKA